LQHLCLILVDLARPKTNYAKTGSFQNRVSLLISIAHLSVLLPVNLDDEFLFVATKVGDIPSDWKLASKFVAIEMPASKDPPKLSLHWTLFTAKFARELGSI